ncbi:MAG: hypothetical protein LBV60_19685 [Streptomyces sp.]|jgi:hypothetical protein|nr:hypothetical protein [Streptomyces sp.]
MSTQFPTAPLSQPALEAMARLEKALGLSTTGSDCSARTARGMRTPTGDYMRCAGGHTSGDLHGAAFGKSGWFSWTDEALLLTVIQAVAQFETAAVHAKELAAVAASGRMSDLDADSLVAAEDLMAASRATLAAAGLLHLIEWGA